MSGSLSAPVRDFLDRFSAAMVAEGLPVPAGRMLGLLFACGGEHTAEDLSGRLGISRSNVSTSVRLLESLGLVERLRRPGERRDLFRLPEEPFRPMLQAGVVRAARLREVVARCRHDLPEGVGEAEHRLDELQTFFEHAGVWLERMREAWPPERRTTTE